MNFFAIPLVAIAISIIICWALFAILCSLLHEAVAQIKAERGRFMKKYLFQQLQDMPNGVNWASLLYLHGTIDLLSRSPDRPTNDIAPHLFAETLVEVVGNAHLVQMQPPVDNKYEHPALYQFKKAIQVLQPSDVVSMLQQSLNSAELSGSVNGAINEALVYKNLVDQIERWYCELTQRLTLWYKKKTRQRLFMLGIVLGLVLNIDSIELFQYFNSYPEARTALMSYYEKNSNTLSALATKASSDTTQQDFSGIVQQTKAYTQQMDSLRKAAVLPVGLEHSVFGNPDKSLHPFLIYKILGIIITGFAASFGAPFWFQVLKKAYSTKV